MWKKLESVRYISMDLHSKIPNFHLKVSKKEQKEKQQKQWLEGVLWTVSRYVLSKVPGEFCKIFKSTYPVSLWERLLSNQSST